MLILNRVVKLGGFRSQNPAEIGLVDISGWKLVILAVIPPGTDAVVAHRALAIAGRNGDAHRAGEILDMALTGAADPPSGRERGAGVPQRGASKTPAG